MNVTDVEGWFINSAISAVCHTPYIEEYLLLTNNQSSVFFKDMIVSVFIGSLSRRTDACILISIFF